MNPSSNCDPTVIRVAVLCDSEQVCNHDRIIRLLSDLNSNRIESIRQHVCPLESNQIRHGFKLVLYDPKTKIRYTERSGWRTEWVIGRTEKARRPDDPPVLCTDTTLHFSLHIFGPWAFFDITHRKSCKRGKTGPLLAMHHVTVPSDSMTVSPNNQWHQPFTLANLHKRGANALTLGEPVSGSFMMEPEQYEFQLPVSFSLTDGFLHSVSGDDPEWISPSLVLLRYDRHLKFFWHFRGVPVMTVNHEKAEFMEKTWPRFFRTDPTSGYLQMSTGHFTHLSEPSVFDRLRFLSIGLEKNLNLLKIVRRIERWSTKDPQLERAVHQTPLPNPEFYRALAWPHGSLSPDLAFKIVLHWLEVFHFSQSGVLVVMINLLKSLRTDEVAPLLQLSSRFMMVSRRLILESFIEKHLDEEKIALIRSWAEGKIK